jgi:hypothetical protein
MASWIANQCKQIVAMIIFIQFNFNYGCNYACQISYDLVKEFQRATGDSEDGRNDNSSNYLLDQLVGLISCLVLRMCNNFILRDYSIFKKKNQHVAFSLLILFVCLFVCLIVFNAIFNNMAVSFIDGGNRRTRRKPPTCRKSLTNLSHNVVHLALIEIRTHNFSGNRH